MSKCTSAVKRCYSSVVTAEQVWLLSEMASFIGRVLDQKPQEEASGNRTQNFGLSHSESFYFWILGKAPLELQSSSTIEGTFCQGELFSWSSLSSDNSHVHVKSVFTSAWQRKYNYVMWLPRERGRVQGTRSHIFTPHTELVME